uniref:Uncharacterized protein n=1 Tax=Oryza brachyantha TaxID=4533 RepID=J3MUX4_ORYBR
PLSERWQGKNQSAKVIDSRPSNQPRKRREAKVLPSGNLGPLLALISSSSSSLAPLTIQFGAHFEDTPLLGFSAQLLKD